MRWLLIALLVVVVALLLLWHPWAPSSGAGAAVRTIVLITADTLRRDHVSAYGDGVRVGLTPRMDALAAQGVRFDDARTPVPLTLPGHTTMLAGLPPAATGVRLNAYGRIPPPDVRGFPLLPELLSDAGWQTGAFLSAAPLLALYGLDQGFDRYDDDGLDDEPPGPSFEERTGEETVKRALAWLDDRKPDERVFLWVHLFDPHAPHTPGLPHEVGYAADVAQCDRAVGQLLDGLAPIGRGEAAILLTADHGEALGEHGELTHGYLLGDAVLRVPFLLRAPGLAAGVRTDPVDLADVAPTLAGLAGVAWPRPAGDVPGRGLDLLAAPVPPTRRRVAETLFAHQRYGWAQLTGAVAPGGGLLVDAGGSRVLWLAPGARGEPQSGPALAGTRAEAAALAPILRGYRDGERKDLIQGGGVAGGYGSGASASPLLDPTANGRLENPYDAIPGVYALSSESQRLWARVSPKAVLPRLERMQKADATNPELAFWVGRAWQYAAERAPTDAEAETARRAAAEAYLEAWRLGRRDANTLGRLAAVDAPGNEARALALLLDLRPSIGEDGLLALLEARLLRALGRTEDADAACRRAAALCRRPWELAALERARRQGVCR